MSTAVTVAVCAAVAWADSRPGSGSASGFGEPKPATGSPTPKATLLTAALPMPDPLPSALLASAGPPGETAVERIGREQIAAEAVAERLVESQATRDTVTTRRALADTRLAAATRNVDAARATVASRAREAYITAADRPAGLPTDPRNRMLGRPGPGLTTAQAALTLAQARYTTALDASAAAATAATAWQRRVNELKTELTRRRVLLNRLRAGQGPALAASDRRQETADAAAASRYLKDATGAAAPTVIKAVAFALTQRGKPYEWGTAGPDRYDCSGLVQTAYAHAGISLPRTARPQYRATQPVPVSALLPGDLLFFATDHNDPNTIHHVGIYLGHGRMLHAPTSGDIVRIAPVWWTEFFAATRVRPGLTTTPTPSPRTHPPTPTPTKAIKTTTAPTPTRTATTGTTPTPLATIPRSVAPTATPATTTPAAPASSPTPVPNPTPTTVPSAITTTQTSASPTPTNGP